MNINLKLQKLSLVLQRLEESKTKEMERLYFLNKTIIQKQNNIEQMSVYKSQYTLDKSTGSSFAVSSLTKNREDFIIYIDSIILMEEKVVSQYTKEKDNVLKLINQIDGKKKAIKGMFDKLQIKTMIKSEKADVQHLENMSILLKESCDV